MEEIESRHKKELKILESDKRQALKKIKGTAGKSQKAKDLLAAAEAEWATKESDMIRRHEEEMASWKEVHQSDTLEPIKVETQFMNPEENVPSSDLIGDKVEANKQDDQQVSSSKKVRKRIQQRQQQLEKEAEIAKSIENAGPSQRELENNRLLELYLTPIQHTIHEIKADGNCLYRAVAHQLEYLTQKQVTYQQIRDICANNIQKNRIEYEPFIEVSGNVGDDFDTYVEMVRNSSDWGGHIELRALANALKRVIIVYSADAAPLYIGDDDNQHIDNRDQDAVACIRLSFHKSFYALGEHYNSVIRL